MSELIANLRLRVAERMSRRFTYQSEGIFANELLNELEGAIREDEDDRVARLQFYPCEPSAGQIEKSEMYMKMVKRMVYWKTRCELLLHGLTGNDCTRILGGEP